MSKEEQSREIRAPELTLIKGIGLVPIKSFKFPGMKITKKMMEDLDPSKWEGMKVYQGRTQRVIGYLEKAWKGEGWWRGDLRVMINLSFGARFSESSLEVDELRIQITDFVDPGWKDNIVLDTEFDVTDVKKLKEKKVGP